MPRFVVKNLETNTFACRDFSTGGFRGGDILDGDEAREKHYLATALLLGRQAAEKAAQELALRYPGTEWAVFPAAEPCPACGREIDNNDRDFIYPTRRDRTEWRAGCNEHDFGCGHEVTAESWEAVVHKWNNEHAPSAS